MPRPLLSLIPFMLIASLLPARQSFAWIATGHSVVALIAWEDLTPKTKKAVVDLLKQHARYEKDLLEDAPKDLSQDELDRYAFAKAATWPDMVRLQDNPMHTLYNHPSWHFIDIPFVNGVQPATEPATDQSGPQNIIQALQQCSIEMKQASVSPKERAVDICWVEHLVGDIHQPLHAASLYSPQHPHGDRGGNEDEVLRDPPYPNSRQNLHLIWDSLPGDFHSQMMDRFEAVGLRADPKFSRDQFKMQLDVKDFMAWAKESHQLAVDDAYLDGHLETAVVQKGSRSSSAAGVPGLPPGYLEKAENVAMHQVALAGYRLADVLNAAFDSVP